MGCNKKVLREKEVLFMTKLKNLIIQMERLDEKIAVAEPQTIYELALLMQRKRLEDSIGTLCRERKVLYDIYRSER